MAEPTLESEVTTSGVDLPDDWMAAIENIDNGDAPPDDIYDQGGDEDLSGGDDDVSATDETGDRSETVTTIASEVESELDQHVEDDSTDDSTDSSPTDDSLAYWQGVAKEDYGASDEWLADKTPEQIEEYLTEVDRNLRNAQMPQPKPKEVPPGQTAPTTEGDGEQLSEFEEQLVARGYDLDDPFVQTMIETKKQNEQLQSQFGEMRSSVNAREAAATQARYNAAFTQEINSLNLPELFGKEGEMTKTQQLAARHVHEGVLDVYQKTGGQWSLKQCIASVIRADFGPELAALRGKERFDQAKKQSASRLGGGGRTAKPKTPKRNPREMDDDYDITLDADLHEAHRKLQEQNG